jgi:hypothetical protein
LRCINAALILGRACLLHECKKQKGSTLTAKPLFLLVLLTGIELVTY